MIVYLSIGGAKSADGWMFSSLEWKLSPWSINADLEEDSS